MKIIYFTAGNVPTTEELAAIASLNSRAAAPFDILVRNSRESNSFGNGIEDADYVAGTRPTAYTSTETFPEPPAGLAPLTGAAINVKNSAASKTVAGTFTVAGGVITQINLPATAAMITTGQAITLGGSTYTFTVALGVVSAIAVS